MISKVDPTIRRVGITGLGVYVPDRILTNADLEKMVDTNDEWITTRTGIKERRIARDDQAASDLAIPAARQALERAGVEPAELDVVIVATSTPDMLFPTTAVIVAEALGANKAAAYDTLAACSGFLYSHLAGVRADRRRRRAEGARHRLGDALEDRRLDGSRHLHPLRGRRGRRRDRAGRERRLPRVRAGRGRQPRQRPLPPRRRLAQPGLAGDDGRRASSGCT